MDIHKYARLTVHCRAELVREGDLDALPVEVALRAAGELAAANFPAMTAPAQPRNGSRIET